MVIKSYRAASIQEALHLVRDDLGPDAAVLQTREVSGNWIQRLFGQRFVEVTAVEGAELPSRYIEGVSRDTRRGARPKRTRPETAGPPLVERDAIPPAHELDYREKYREDLKSQLSDLESKVNHLVRQQQDVRSVWTDSVFRLFADLLDAELDDDVARDLVNRVVKESPPREQHDLPVLRSRLARLVESQIRIHGPIQVVPGHPRLVALIGPTGVGKTTTIAKLAANFHLREQRRVGLITVDTYRIAAIDQLRMYADIIDLPMEVVTHPQELPEAMARLGHLDLVLMDTAGRGVCDEARIQELRDLLQVAKADEVHLVLSSVSSRSSLLKTTRHFRQVGATALLLTKLDEATGLGNLLPLFQDSELPLSYVTHGQDVPDDISNADARQLARQIVGREAAR